MGKVLTTDTQAMKENASKLEEISAAYTEIYTQLMQKAETMGSAWDSEDNLAFVTQITGFSDDLKLMATKLQNAAEILRQQSTNYETLVNENVASVKKLAN